jgi:hypothetical protein
LGPSAPPVAARFFPTAVPPLICAASCGASVNAGGLNIFLPFASNVGTFADADADGAVASE